MSQYLEANYKNVDKKVMGTQLKNMVDQGKLVPIKSSYKLSPEFVRARAGGARSAGTHRMSVLQLSGGGGAVPVARLSCFLIC